MSKGIKGKRVEPVKVSKKRVERDDDEGMSDDGEDLLVKSQNYIEKDDSEEESEEMEEDESEDVEDSEEVSEADMEDSDVMEGSDQEEQSVNKANQTEKSKLFKPPSANELSDLFNVDDQYGSSLFKLQIDELVSNVAVKFGKHSELDKGLKDIKACMENTVDVFDLSITEAIGSMSGKGVKIPFSDPKPGPDTNYRLAYMKPSRIHLIGSYPLKTMVLRSEKPIEVELAVEMPPMLFQEKDYVNHRYFHKRAFYLANLAAKLISSGYDVKYELLDDDQRKPILVARLKSVGQHYAIKILPYISPSTIATRRFGPSKNNARLSNLSPIDTQPPTPQYNTALARDSLYLSHMTFIHQFTKTCPALQTTIILAKTWLARRGFGSDTVKGFSGFVVTMLICYLLGNKPLGGGLKSFLSSYQLFKALIELIASHDFNKKPIMIGKVDDETFSPATFKKHFEISIIDPTGYVNLVPNMTKHEMALVQHDAKLALEVMRGNRPDRFEALFIDNAKDLHLKFDNVFSFHMSRGLPNSWHTLVDKLDNPSHYLQLVKKLPDLLNRGLTDRVKLVSIYYQGFPSWSVDKDFNKSSIAKNPIQVGLLLDPESALRIVDRGPSPQDVTGSAKFRELWGNIAELRRFQDGNIVESVVWQCDHIEDRRLIIQRIVSHLISHHLKVKDVTFWAGQLFPYLHLPSSTKRGHSYMPTTQKGYQPALESFDRLAAVIKKVDGLPLNVAKVLKADDSLRYTSVFIPQPVPSNIEMLPTSQRFCAPMEVVVEFHSSSSWPTHLEAIQRLKLALMLRIKSQLEAQAGYQGTVAQNPLDSTTSSIYPDSYLDILTPDLFLFRCRIHCELDEPLLLKGIEDAKDSKSAQLTRQFQQAHIQYQGQFQFKPYVSSHLHSLCQTHSTLSYTIRLIKRWSSAHLLSQHLSDEALELICASVYLTSRSLTTPASAVAGFCRVLQVLAHHPFTLNPIEVNFNQESFPVHLIKSDKKTIQVASINSELDLNSCPSLYTTPTAIIRLQKLAKASLLSIHTYLQTSQTINIQRVFVTPTNQFNLVLQLDKAKCARYYQAIKPKSTSGDEDIMKLKRVKVDENAANRDVLSKARLDFDVVERFVAELKSRLNPTIQIFGDKYGGTKLGIHIDKSVTHPTNLKLTATHPVRLHHDDENNNEGCDLSYPSVNKVTLDYSGVINQIYRLGKGLVIPPSTNQS